MSYLTLTVQKVLYWGKKKNPNKTKALLLSVTHGGVEELVSVRLMPICVWLTMLTFVVFACYVCKLRAVGYDNMS